MRPTLCLILLLTVGACRFDSPDTPTETPPVILRDSYPVANADSIGLEPLDIVLRFNEAIPVTEVTTLRMVPKPSSAGIFEAAGTGRELVWHDVVRVPAPSHKLLVDGPHFLQPELLEFYPEAPYSGAAISGNARLVQPNGNAENTVLYALRMSPGGRAVADSLFGYPIEDVTIAEYIPTQGLPWYRFDQLAGGMSYVVVGILDTDGDGRYSVFTDWWAYPIDRATGRARSIVAVSPILGEVTDALVELVAPGTLPPPFAF